jgi:hypothetical protein
MGELKEINAEDMSLAQFAASQLVDAAFPVERDFDREIIEKRLEDAFVHLNVMVRCEGLVLHTAIQDSDNAGDDNRRARCAFTLSATYGSFNISEHRLVTDCLSLITDYRPQQKRDGDPLDALRKDLAHRMYQFLTNQVDALIS